MSSWKIGVMSVAALAAIGTAGCRKESLTDQGQIGVSVGEVMASASESASAGSSAAPASSAASAGACYPFTFSACSAGVRTETFSGCTFGRAIVDGSVTLTFSDTAGCGLATGDSVTRTADFTITGDYGGALAVTSPGGGQTLTRTATGFDFAVGGIERVLTGPRGTALFDISTQTTTPLSISTSSGNFAIEAGTLVITHHLAGYAVSLTPDNLTWTPTCSCAVSGSLSGTVSGGKADGKSATVTLTGCGTADVTIDGDTESVTMDRCASL